MDTDSGLLLLLSSPALSLLFWRAKHEEALFHFVQSRRVWGCTQYESLGLGGPFHRARWFDGPVVNGVGLKVGLESVAAPDDVLLQVGHFHFEVLYIWVIATVPEDEVHRLAGRGGLPPEFRVEGIHEDRLAEALVGFW